MNFPCNHHHREDVQFDRAKIPLQGITGFHLKNVQWVLIYYFQWLNFKAQSSVLSIHLLLRKLIRKLFYT